MRTMNETKGNCKTENLKEDEKTEIRKQVNDMQVKDIQRLIDNPLQPNAAEWVMDVEDILSETKTGTKEIDNALHLVSVHNGAFPQYTDFVVATLKRLIRKIEKSSDNKNI